MPRASRIWVRDNIFRIYKMLIARSEIERYLAQAGAPKLNLGAGGNRLKGWLNVDLYPPPGTVFMNASTRWPFPDNTFDAVLCEHMIEHVPKDMGLHLLREAFRTARPGAGLRVVTPDLDFFAQAVLHGATEAESYLHFAEGFNNLQNLSWTDAINLIFYEHGHRYIYSRSALRSAVEAAGFQITAEMRGGVYSNPLFNGVDGHPALTGHVPNAIEAFAIEARKPAGQSIPDQYAPRLESNAGTVSRMICKSSATVLVRT